MTEVQVDGFPSETDVRAIVREILGHDCATVSRFPTGLAHFVYDVELDDQSRIVARLSQPSERALGESSIYWNEELRPLGVPLPTILGCNLDAKWPAVLLARLPGTDLQHVYPELSSRERRDIANEVCAVQKLVSETDHGIGYGYGHSRADPSLLPGWSDVVESQVERSRARLGTSGTGDSQAVRSLRDEIEANRGDLDQIAPVPVLDDTTTKNVIIHDGCLAGIVDVDRVLFGDPLFPLALTDVALASRGWTTDYTDAWFAAGAWSDGDRWRRDLYIRVFALGFLSEIGLSFNRADAEVADEATIMRLTTLLEGKKL